MRLARAFNRVPRFTATLWFKIGLVAAIVCLILLIPSFLRGPADRKDDKLSEHEKSGQQAVEGHHLDSVKDNQVESPEGNAYDHGSQHDKDHQQQIALPDLNENKIVAAVIDAVPAARDEPERENPNGVKQRRNIPAPRKKPLPVHREDPNDIQKPVDDNNKQVARPPPKPRSDKTAEEATDLDQNEENEIRDDETGNSLKVPLFREGSVGNFEVTEKKRKGPGEYGLAVRLTPEEKSEAERANHEYGFNQIASDKISLNRSIPDTRPAECKFWHYPTKLPKVSVVIAFHNEMWSTLLRTVHSVINRTPPDLLEEVLMVDDFSDKEPLKKALEEYIEKFNGKVRLIRNKDREGLIRTRSNGAKAATGQVIFFLDAHCEVGINWLPPLLAPIARDRTIMTVPVIDGIDSDTFEIHAQYQGKLFRGIFEWGLLYKETELPEKEMKRRQRSSEPYKSPTHAGGLFAINREYFLELGGYDDGLLIWGGEQYELSFKIWQCGGSIEWVPCSHIGHIYRGFMPYGFGKLSGKGPIVSLNLKRVAEVWMDEYKEYYYIREPMVRDLEEGDVSEQKAIRQRLNCKSFKWYMENVAYDVTEEFPLLPANLFWGELRSVKDTWQCWDSRRDAPAKINISPCHHGGGHQLLRLNTQGQLAIGERCVEVDTTGQLELIYCPKGKVNGSWQYLNATQQVKHQTKGKCAERHSDERLLLKPCDHQSDGQRWEFQKVKAQ